MGNVTVWNLDSDTSFDLEVFITVLQEFKAKSLKCCCRLRGECSAVFPVILEDSSGTSVNKNCFLPLCDLTEENWTPSH